MTTFETLRIDMFKILCDFDDDHPLWDIWFSIYEAEERFHKLESVANSARVYFKGAELCYCNGYEGECSPCYELRLEAEQKLKELDEQK